MAARFEDLRTLKDGWHEGSGLAPDGKALDQIADRMVGHFPTTLPLPAIIPTPEGNLLFEWNSPGQPSMDIQLPELKAEFHAFREDAEDIEHEFDLSAEEAWPKLFATLLQTT